MFACSVPDRRGGPFGVRWQSPLRTATPLWLSMLAASFGPHSLRERTAKAASLPPHSKSRYAILNCMKTPVVSSRFSQRARRFAL